MALFAPQAHAALLGADALLGNLDDSSDDTTTVPVPPMVINKSGSCPLALCCRFAGVPVLVVSSDLKARNEEAA
jgi:translation initiation factor 2B subunit (eIF-2B alpha/beta/delta family)